MNNPATNPPAPAAQRLVSLDAFRGLIMLTLLFGGVFQPLRDVPGWHWLAVQNDHVAWEGCVFWDLIQPAFMFMVGAAMPFALAKRAAQGDSWSRRFGHVLLRGFNLMLVGIILDHVGQDKIQIGLIRVLQQIAIGYVLAFFVAEKSWRVQSNIIAGIIPIEHPPVERTADVFPTHGPRSAGAVPGIEHPEQVPAGENHRHCYGLNTP